MNEPNDLPDLKEVLTGGPSSTGPLGRRESNDGELLADKGPEVELARGGLLDNSYHQRIASGDCYASSVTDRPRRARDASDALHLDAQLGGGDWHQIGRSRTRWR